MRRWDQDVVVSNHRSVQATAMSIDFTGMLAVLGSKRHLVVIDLDNPTEVKDKINVGSKYELSHVVWNPSKSHSQYFLTTYSQNCDIWQYGDQSTGTKLLTVQGHTRAISDANWSYAHPNMLATCSLDSFICLWDIRESKRAKVAMTTVAGASQIKWNKKNDYNIASAHDGNIRVWDIRSPKSPVHYLMAHVSNIYSLDWSPLSANTLVSASQDATICFWDIASNDAKFRISAGYPVWRVQYNPNHHSITSVSFKNVRESPICLWDISDMETVTQTFSSHSDVVLDVQWRKQKDKNLWQLVTWCKDQSMRFCQPTFDFSKYNVVSEQDSNEIFYPQARAKTSKTADLKPNMYTKIDDKAGSPSQTLSYQSTFDRRNKSYSLDSELNSVKLSNFPGIQIEETSASSRFCVARITWQIVVFKMTIKFPRGYPLYSAPTFEFTPECTPSNSQDSVRINNLRKLLVYVTKQTSTSCSNSHMLGYLKVCLQGVSNMLQQSQLDSLTVQSRHFPVTDELMQSLKCIPFPRTCGASFCGAGNLVVFVGPTCHKLTQGQMERTPKSLKSLVTYQSPTYFIGPNGEKEHYGAANLSAFNMATPQGKRMKRSHKNFMLYYDGKYSKRLTPALGRVSIFDMAPYMSISRLLANTYKTKLSADICHVNKQHAQSLKHPHLSRLWSCMEMLPDPISIRKPMENSLATHYLHTPAGCQFLDKLFGHYAKRKDVQTLAHLAPLYRDVTTKPTAAKSSSTPQLHIHKSCSENLLVAEPNLAPTSTPKTPIMVKPSRKMNTFRPAINHHRQVSNPECLMTPNLRNSYESTKSLNLKYFPPNATFLEDSVELDEKESSVDEDDIDVPDAAPFPANPKLPTVATNSNYDTAISAYVDYLKRIDHNSKGLEMQEYLFNKNLSVRDLVEVSVCNKYQSYYDTNQPPQKPPILRCTICQVPIKGNVYSFCLKCGHGGHLKHIKSWFQQSKVCPSGSCSCVCPL